MRLLRYLILASNITFFNRKEMNELDYSSKMAGSNEQFFISVTFIAGHYAGMCC